MKGSWPASSPTGPTPVLTPAPPRAQGRGALPHDVGLPVAAVAQRLGVAPATLRTWARRYGLGPTAHLAGSHRRYGAGDVRRLAVMRRLTMEGVSPADAARTALASTDDVTLPGSGRSDDLPSARPGRRAPAQPDPHPAASPATRTTRAPGRPRPVQLPWGQESDRAAVALDPEHTLRTVTAAFDGLGLLAGWDQVVGPALLALSRAWETTGPGYDSELMLTAAVLAALRARTVPPPSAGRPALLAPAEDERDALVLHVVAAALAERGVSCQVLAPGRPRQALAAAVRSTDPAGVMLLATSPVRDLDQLSALAHLPASTCLVMVGAGWAAADAGELVVAARSRVVGSLAEAVDLVGGCSLVGPSAC